MKKLLALVMSVLLCCGLSACSSGNQSTESDLSSFDKPASTSTTTTTTTPKISTTTKPVHTHQFSSASCTSPAKCSCGATQGNALGHSFSKATCTSPAKCSRCGVTNGQAAGHSFSSGKCTVCGTSDPGFLPESTKKSILDNLDQAISDLELSWSAYNDCTDKTMDDPFYGTAVTLAKRAGNYIGIAHTLALSYPKATLSDGHYVVDGLSTLKQVTALLAAGPYEDSYTQVVDFAKKIRSQIK